ncbi:hypothetical protein QBC34DRAFT_493994 [Podospora aff. communis PSN243]|uniref:Protein kinase domain-containing protein n=1 Tax=Podospora aff. communis PSN243 TaxID=3040156 RepID=A0AAV9GRR0_9PEZI|nr:hypothetical protein QBC34DRAFT_493994 [Podospora aff. communis PSN243]
MSGFQFFAASPRATRSGTDTSTSAFRPSSNQTNRGIPQRSVPGSSFSDTQVVSTRRILPASKVADPHIHDLIALVGTVEPVSTVGTEQFGHQSAHYAGTICRVEYHVIGQGATFVAKRVKGDCKCNKSGFVVVKSPRITSRTEDVGQGIRKRLKHILFEIRVLTHEPLVGHPNIVRFLGITWEDDLYDYNIKWPALLLEYADAGSLGQAIANNALPAKLRLNICLDVASGLDALHGCGIIHCDVKPDNVLLFADEKRELVAKLSDFGLSLADTGEGTQLPGRTPGWNAPEWRSWIPSNCLAKADIYSFGLLVWSVMTMTKDPFRGIGLPISTHLQEIEMLKASDRLMLQKVLSHLRTRSTVYTGSAIASAVKAIQATVKKVPSERNLASAMDALKEGILKDDLNVPPEIQPGTMDVLSACQSIWNMAQSRAGDVPLSEGQIWRICTLLSSLTGITSQELTELKRRHNNKTDKSFFDRYCVLAGGRKSKDRIKQSSDPQDVSKFSAAYVRGLHPHVQDMVRDSLIRAAAAGSQDAALFLSIFFTNVRFDSAKACEYLLQAARLRSSSAMYLCHRMHRAHGVPLDVSFVEKATWFHTGICWGSQIAYEQAKEDDPSALWGASIILAAQGSCFGDVPFRDAERAGPFNLLFDSLEDILSKARSLHQHVDDIILAGEDRDTLLHWAAAVHKCPGQRHHDILPGLLSQAGANPNVRNAKGETPLLFAFKAANAQAAAELLNAGADPTIASNAGQVPLHWLWAIPDYGRGDPSLQERVLPVLANVLCKGASPGTLHAVADALTVRLRGEAEPDQVTRLQSYILSGMPAGTPLHWAVQRRSLSTIKALLASGARPSALAVGAETQGTAQIFPLSAVHLAAGMHDCDILELFLRAEPDCLKNTTPCALAMAIDGSICSGYANGRFERMARHGPMYRERARKTFQLFRDQDYASLRAGFETVVDNGPMQRPPSPLLLAVQSGQADVVQALLETPYKRDINLKCGMANFSPLQESIKQRCPEIYFTLRRHGADPLATCWAKDGVSNNLCLLATFGGSNDLGIARDLIEAGNPVCAGDPANYSPLLEALRHGFFPLARLLLDHGADPNELRASRSKIHHLDEHTIDAPTTLFGTMLLGFGRHRMRPLSWLLEEHAAGRLSTPLQTTVCPQTAFNIFHLLGFSSEDGREDGASVSAFHLLRSAFPDKELLNAAGRAEESETLGTKKLTPLLTAIQSFDLHLVKAMIAAGADPTMDLGDGLTVLDLAKEHAEEFATCMRLREFPARLLPSDYSDLPKMLARRREIVTVLEEEFRLRGNPDDGEAPSS